MFSNVGSLKYKEIEFSKFPSPFGVICSLIFLNFLILEAFQFPSPFGVICSLIILKTYLTMMNMLGFRLLSELYVL